MRWFFLITALVGFSCKDYGRIPPYTHPQFGDGCAHSPCSCVKGEFCPYLPPSCLVPSSRDEGGAHVYQFHWHHTESCAAGEGHTKDCHIEDFQRRCIGTAVEPVYLQRWIER